MSYVKILQLIIIYTAFKCVDLLFFLVISKSQLENLYKKFSHSKAVTLEKGCKDGQKRLSFCFNLMCIFL